MSTIPPKGENPSTGTNVYPITWHPSAVLLQTKPLEINNYFILNNFLFPSISDWAASFDMLLALKQAIILACFLSTEDHRHELSHPTHLIQQQPLLTHVCGNAWPWRAFQVEKTIFSF